MDDEEEGEDRQYCPPSFADREMEDGTVVDGQWRDEARQSGGLRPFPATTTHNYTRNASDIREAFTRYFTTPEGEVDWQYAYVRRGTVPDHVDDFSDEDSR